MATNTGYKAWLKLIKVVDGGPYDGSPLDDNNDLTSISGLPQSSKDNIDTDPDYVPPVLNTTDCPVPITTVNITAIVDSLVTDPIELIVTDLADNVILVNTPIAIGTTPFVTHPALPGGLLKVQIFNDGTTVPVKYTVSNLSGYNQTGNIPFGASITLSNVPKLDFTVNIEEV